MYSAVYNAVIERNGIAIIQGTGRPGISEKDHDTSVTIVGSLFGLFLTIT
jgi:hypothetical protein